MVCALRAGVVVGNPFKVAVRVIIRNRQRPVGHHAALHGFKLRRHEVTRHGCRPARQHRHLARNPHTAFADAQPRTLVRIERRRHRPVLAQEHRHREIGQASLVVSGGKAVKIDEVVDGEIGCNPLVAIHQILNPHHRGKGPARAVRVLVPNRREVGRPLPIDVPQVVARWKCGRRLQQPPPRRPLDPVRVMRERMRMPPQSLGHLIRHHAAGRHHDRSQHHHRRLHAIDKPLQRETLRVAEGLIVRISRRTLAAQKHLLRPCRWAWESAQDRAL